MGNDEDVSTWTNGALAQTLEEFAEIEEDTRPGSDSFPVEVYREAARRLRQQAQTEAES